MIRRKASEIVKSAIASGIPIERIALDCGVSAGTVYRWMNGSAKPHRVFFSKLEKIGQLVTK